MNLRLLDSLPPELTARLALVLLHSLWQASLLSALLWLVLRGLGAAHPQSRYRLSVAALALVVVMSVITWSFLGRASVKKLDAAPAPGSEAIASPSSPAMPSRAPDAAFPTPQGNEMHVRRPGAGALTDAASATGNSASLPFQQWSRALAAAWFVGAGLMLLRVLLAVQAGRRLVRSARPLEAPLVAELVAELRQKLGLWRRVRVKVCDRVDVPAVLGAVWPVLLVPPALVAGLPVEQLRVILTHELAHVRRYDYLVNLGQLLVEAGLFFNPAVWWLSRRIRIEREACCDALAVSLTGQPLAVARTLVDCAQSAWGESLLGGEPRRGAMLSWPVTAQAYDGRAPQGTLWERVRRIVMPQEIPQVRLPWYTLAGLLIGGCALLVGLEQGGELALKAADRWLTPKQRVEKLAEIEKDYAQPSEAPKQLPPKFRIAGAARMADGSPLPEKANLHASVSRRGYSGADYLPLDAGGRFAKEFSAERVYLHLRAPGFATTFAGPFDAADGDVRGVEVTLEQGFPTRIRFVNQAGEGTPGVVLKQIQYRLPNRGDNGWTGYRHPQQDEHLESDAEGYVTLTSCSDWPVTIDVRGGGYQFEQSEHRLQPDGTLIWKLKRARPTNGRVVDDATGQPISGAELYLVKREGYADWSEDPRDAMTTPTLLASSGVDGRFQLDSLRDDCEYAFYIRADGHAVKLLQELHAGQRDLEVRLGPELYVKGRILGKLDSLPIDRKTQQRVLRYRNRLRLRDGGYDMGLEANVHIDKGVGQFELTNLFPGPVSLRLPDRTISLDVTKPIDDLVIDLKAPPKPAATFENLPRRDVILNFDVPAGAPAPRGKLRVGFQLRPRSNAEAHESPGRYEQYREQFFDVTGNKLRFQAPAGTTMFFDCRKLVGYWVKNRSDIDVAEGEAPLEITLDALPAGGIFGRVLNSQGLPTANCAVHLLTVEMAPKQTSSSFQQVDVKNASGRFALGQLPLGGRYRVLAVDKDSEARALSDELTIDEQHPLHEVKLQFVDGTPFAVQVLGPDGSPASGIGLEFGYTSPDRHSFGRARKLTGPDGRFVFEHIDPQLPGRYSLAVGPGADLCGASFKLDDLTQPLTVRLDQGQSLKGVLIDALNRQPVADARIVAMLAPSEYARARYYGLIETRTDSAGRFEFHNLEALRYRLVVYGARRIVSKIQFSGPGTTPGEDGETLVQPGQNASVTVAITRSQPSSQSRD